MTIALTHTTVAVGTDAGNGEIHKAQWNEAHTLSMATNKLLGRSTAGTGAVEEIGIGSGLSLSAGTLSATGGGGGGALTISNKTAAYTVVAGDLGTIINCNGAFTVSLTAAATLGSGFNCWVWNTSSTATDAIVINPAGTETIDGTDTFTLQRGEGMQIVCDGTNWQTGDKKTMRAYAENLSVAGNDIYRPSVSGQNSVAIGWRAIASAGDSVAIGSQATASGDMSYAFGGVTTAAAAASTAIGANSGYGGSKTATGAGAMALGGSYASGSNSLAAAIANNTSSFGATGANSVAMGSGTKATNSHTYAIGRSAIASAVSAIALGGLSNTASGQYSVVMGGSTNIASGMSSLAGGGGISLTGATADADGSFCWGEGAAANGVKGRVVFGPPVNGFAALDGALSISIQTTDATATKLTVDQSAANTTNQLILTNNTAYAFSGLIVARKQASGGTDSAAWKIEGLIRREGSAATTTLVASTVTAISNVPGWTIALSADTTNGGLSVTATGAATTNIRWVATIDTAEVTY